MNACIRPVENEEILRRRLLGECFFQTEAVKGGACLRQNHQGAELELEGRLLARVEGRCQLVTDRGGALQSLIGIEPEIVTVKVHLPDGTVLHIRCGPDQKIEF